MFYKKKLQLAFVFAFSFIFISCSNSEDTVSFEAMNTFMTIRSFGRNSAKANLEVKARIEQIENTISTTKENSEVWKINHADGKEINISADTKELAVFSLDIASRTNGALNPCLYPVIREWGFTTQEYKVPQKDEISTLLLKTDYSKVQFKSEDGKNYLKIEPQMMIDFGAVGKGYAGDEAIKILKANGIKSAILDLGGNVQTLGSKTDGTDWTIGIKNPFEISAAPVASLKISEKAVITSGGYERYFIDEATNHKYIHIFDGKTGSPVENNIASATIVATSGLYADALSTSFVVFGVEEAINFWKKYTDFDFILITKDQNIYYSEGLESNLRFLYDFSNINKVAKF